MDPITRAGLTALLQKHEGFSEFPYHDMTGALTIGYGRNLTAVGVSESEARALMGHVKHRATAIALMIQSGDWVQ